MKNREAKNIPASVQSRLLTQARSRGRPYQELLEYYAIERFLYRMSLSKHRQAFVLKGALLFQAWGFAEFRPTRDIDLLGYTTNEIVNLVEIVKEICQLPVQGDGVVFDPESVRAERINEAADYQGIRLRFQGRLGKIHLPMQIDVGFADVVSPAPITLKYPVLLSMPAPELRGYPPETVVAEKFQAMVFLGEINSRMKDFFDLWVLASRFAVEGSTLQRAVAETFAKRHTPTAIDIPALTDRFASEKQIQWTAFVKRSHLEQAPANLSEANSLLRGFLMPVMEACLKNADMTGTWSPGGPWSR